MAVSCQWAAPNDLVLDAGTCYGQIRRVNMDWVDGLVEQFTGNPPKELERTVWKDTGVLRPPSVHGAGPV